MKPLCRGLALLMTLGAIGVVPGIQAQQVAENRQESQTLTELLAEVRALRVAIERSGAASASAQLLLGRLQIQEGRMGTLGRQVQEARARLMELQRDRENTTVDIRHVTATLDQLPPDQRRNMETRIESMKKSIKRSEQRERDLQSELDGVTQALSSEQARWLDFNERLEELERSLAPRKE